MTVLLKAEEELIKLLKERIKEVPPENVVVEEPKELPAIVIVQHDFFIEESGVGASPVEKKVEIEELFSGNGSKREFRLKEKPVKPLLRVEHPIGIILREKLDYKVDYLAGKIEFRKPPEEGEKNIRVTYYASKSISEIRTFRLIIRYRIDIWSKSREEREKITCKVIEAILVGRDRLIEKGIDIRPVRGYNITGKTGVFARAYGKALECIVEVAATAEIPYKRIEKIEIKRV